jgi:glycosyltransferase involved in cell wall biosynthesis
MVAPNIVSFRSFLTELGSALACRGVDVHCACSGNALWGENQAPACGTGVRMHDLQFPRGMDFIGHIRSSIQLDRLVERLRPDLVHAHFSAAIFTTALARRSHWPTTIGTFQGLRFPLLTGLKRRALTAVEAWSAKRLDAVWVLTEDDRTALASAAPGATVNRQTSCGFGCDLDRFDPACVCSEECQDLRARLGIAADRWIFSYIGRYVAFKGFDMTVRAFLRLAELDPKVHLLLMGARDKLHPTGLTPEEERRLKNSPRITDLGWQDDVRKWLAVTNVLIAPSCREGMPVSLMEALAMGAPVITRDSRGCRDVVRDGVNGIVLRECTVDGLVSAMQSIKENEMLYRRLSSNALKDRQSFSRLNYIDEQIRIYENMTGRII